MHRLSYFFGLLLLNSGICFLSPMLYMSYVSCSALATFGDSKLRLSCIASAAHDMPIMVFFVPVASTMLICLNILHRQRTSELRSGSIATLTKSSFGMTATRHAITVGFFGSCLALGLYIGAVVYKGRCLSIAQGRELISSARCARP